jgi:hypothetical protein
MCGQIWHFCMYAIAWVKTHKRKMLSLRMWMKKKNWKWNCLKKASKKCITDSEVSFQFRHNACASNLTSSRTSFVCMWCRNCQLGKENFFSFRRARTMTHRVDKSLPLLSRQKKSRCMCCTFDFDINFTTHIISFANEATSV